MHSHPSIRRVVRFLDGPLVRYIVIAAYAYFFLIILSEVAMRYFFAHSTTWGEMTARYAFVYFAYVAMAEAFRHDEHIRIDLIPNRLGPRARKALETYIDLLCVAISVAVIWYSIQLMQIQQMANIRMHALPLNLSWAQAALPLGWALMIIRIAQRMTRRFAPTPSATGMIHTATSQGAVYHG
ncbi:hypothetical protein NBRC116599_42160 [Aquicoccus sp. SU-CL01552]